MPKIKVMIDYPVKSGQEYRGLAFPPLLYSFLKKDDRFEVFSSLDRDVKNLDILLVISGGSHNSLKNTTLKTFDFKQVMKMLMTKYDKLSCFIGRFVGLDKMGYYKRHMKSNTMYEKRVKEFLRQNPKLKIVHRLDGLYQNVCKSYGYDHTVGAINKMADVTVHQSQYSKRIWENGINTIFGHSVTLNSKKSVIIHNGVDTDIFSKTGTKKNFPGKWKLLHVSASPNASKGLKTVIEMAEIFKNNEEIQFYLVGRQPDDPVCGKDIKKFKNIHYLGFIDDRKELSVIYRSCDIFIFPALNDCSPNVIIEAMSSGLPIMSIDSGGNKELFIKDDMHAGVLINKENPAQALKIIIENYQNFRENAYEIVSKYHTQKMMCESYKSVFFEAVSVCR